MPFPSQLKSGRTKGGGGGGGEEHVFKNASEIRRSLSASVVLKPTSDLDRAENGLK